MFTMFARNIRSLIAAVRGPRLKQFALLGGFVLATLVTTICCWKMSFMGVLLPVLILAYGSIATLTAIGGDTWNRERAWGQGRIEYRGWIAIICLAFSFCVGAIKEYWLHCQSEESKSVQVRIKDIEDLKKVVTGLVSKTGEQLQKQVENTEGELKKQVEKTEGELQRNAEQQAAQTSGALKAQIGMTRSDLKQQIATTRDDLRRQTDAVKIAVETAQTALREQLDAASEAIRLKTSLANAFVHGSLLETRSAVLRDLDRAFIGLRWQAGLSQAALRLNATALNRQIEDADQRLQNQYARLQTQYATTQSQLVAAINALSELTNPDSGVLAHINGVNHGLKQQITGVDNGLKQQIAGVDNGLKQQLDQLREQVETLKKKVEAMPGLSSDMR